MKNQVAIEIVKFYNPTKLPRFSPKSHVHNLSLSDYSFFGGLSLLRRASGRSLLKLCSPPPPSSATAATHKEDHTTAPNIYSTTTLQSEAYNRYCHRYAAKNTPTLTLLDHRTTSTAGLRTSFILISSSDNQILSENTSNTPTPTLLDHRQLFDVLKQKEDTTLLCHPNFDQELMKLKTNKRS